MNSLDLQARANDLFMPLYPHKDRALVRGEGCYVFDLEDRKYLDCAAGIAVCALGHNHPVFNKAIEEQVAKGFTMCVGSFATEPKVKAAELLINNCCTDKIFFCNSGAEAIEGALKLSRAWAHYERGEDCKEIIVFKNSFHGRTYGAVSGTAKSLVQPQFAPYLSGFHFADFNDLDSVKSIISDKICAILVEPIQGEGGLTAGTPEFLNGLRKLCDEHNIVMISDEIQAGMGRMGHLHAHAHFGYEPDIVTLAKGLGAGFPVGAFMAKSHIAKAFKPGDHGSTYAGNPLATNVVAHVVGEISKPDFLKRVQEASVYFHEQLENLKARTGDCITEIKGRGLMIGVDTKFKVADLLSALLEHGLLATQAGSNTLRLTPPLIITNAEIDEAVSKIEHVLKTVDA
jgi:acetylornithine/N-succinyldiaminopimelate aminotransferase